MSFTTGNDINILQTSDTLNMGAGVGNDKYILSSGSGLTAGQVINISDTQGTNTLQLIGGLTIASSKAGASVLQLTLSNGAVINLNGANTFSFEIGGSPFAGTAGTIQTFNNFVTNSLGATMPVGSAISNGAANVLVNNDGTTSAGPAAGTAPATLSTKADAQSVKILTVGTLATLSSPEVVGVKADSSWDKTKLTYSFNTALPADYIGNVQDTNQWQVLNAAEKSSVTSAYTKLAALINIGFSEVAAETGDMRFSVVNMPASQTGYAYYPGAGVGGDVFLSLQNRSTSNFYTGNSGGVSTVAHEIGHAMGLKHSFEAPTVPAGTDNSDYSIMTYTQVRYSVPVHTIAADKSISTAFPNSLRVEYAIDDVQALQAIYGANLQTRTSNDVYTLKFVDHQTLTIWDAGGTDLIDASAATGVCVVDLRAGSLSSIDIKPLAVQQAEALAVLQPQLPYSITSYLNSIYTGASSALFYTGQNNLSIVKGVVIENLTTGSAGDTVTDNSVNNIINTGAGDDKIYLGNGGYDTVDGGTGQDTVFLGVLRSSIQQEHLTDGSYLLVGSGFAAKLIGIETVTCSDGNLLLV